MAGLSAEIIKHDNMPGKPTKPGKPIINYSDEKYIHNTYFGILHFGGL